MPLWKSVVPHQEEWRRGLRRFGVGAKSFNGYEQNKVFRNNGDGTFAEVGWAAGGDVIVDCRSCAVADFDRDGRMDIAVRALLERSFFLHNEAEAGRFLHVRLVGTRSNRMGVGARVTAEAGADRYTAEMSCGSGFLSQSEPAIHLGLGRHDRVDRLVVRWPSGLVQEFHGVPADGFATVTEGESQLAVEPPRSSLCPPARTDNALARLLSDGRFRDLEDRPVAAAPTAPVTLLHVWSPSCGACDKEVGTLGALQKLESDGRFAVLAIAVDASVEQVKAYVAEHRITYRVLVADADAGRALTAMPDGSWRRRHQSIDGLVRVDETVWPDVPWTGVVDRSGLRRCFRGPVKHFEAKQEVLMALSETR